MIVFFDLETGGLELDHPIIQLAAIATDENGVELSSFNKLVQFDEATADPGALIINHYDPDRWAAEAIPQADAVKQFSRWLDGFKSIERIAKTTGRPYYVARLAGYNAAVFDQPRLRKFFGASFLPAYNHVLDVKYLADWYFHERGVEVSLRLANVAALLGITVEKAHDALSDVRATAAVAFELKKRCFRGIY